MPLIFVYGTLKRGYLNHQLLDGAEFLGEAETLPCYRMFNLSFPCLVETAPGKGRCCKGEVYRVNDWTLECIDRLEQVPYLYHRDWIKLLQEFGEPVHGYLWQLGTEHLPECSPEWTLDSPRPDFRENLKTMA